MTESNLVIAPGSSLGDYRIVRLLGAGGMGKVFEASHVKLGRRVAIKLLTTHKDPQLLTRLEREARAAAQMHHPNIVQVTELHVPEAPSEADPAYMVMEYVDGDTLQHRLDDTRRLAPALVRRIGVQMASALGYAHARGVVHRDVKPANLLLTDVPGVGLVAKLLDFGIARLIEETALTRAGTLIGTPSFMSPEQALARPVGPPSDVFGLGATLYLALFGKLPFPGRGLDELSMQLASPLEATAPTDIDVNDRALTDAILRCLSKDPEKRPTSGMELQRVFELEDEDTHPLPGSERPAAMHAPPTFIREAPRSGPRTLVAMGGGAALVVLAAVGVARLRPGAPHEPVPTVQEPAADAAPNPSPLPHSDRDDYLGTGEPDAPLAGAVPTDLVLGGNRPCALLSSGEVFCWSLDHAQLYPARVPGTLQRRVEEIRYADHRVVLRAGREHLLFLGNDVLESSERHRSWFRHAPVSLGEDPPLDWTCPQSARGCFVWSKGSMRWADEERGVLRDLPPAPQCQDAPVEGAHAAGASLWLLRCGKLAYFLVHDQLRDRRPPEDLFFTRVIAGLPPKSQILGTGTGTIKVRLEGGKAFSYHPQLTLPASDPAWKLGTPIDAGYRIPFGPTEKVAPDSPASPCVLAGGTIECTGGEPELAERARALGATFGAAGPRRVWSSAEGIVCALGDGGPLAWTLRCVGEDKEHAQDHAGDAPRDVLF